MEAKISGSKNIHKKVQVDCEDLEIVEESKNPVFLWVKKEIVENEVEN